MMHSSNKSAASTLLTLSALLSIATPFLSSTAAAHGVHAGAGHLHHKKAALAAAPARSRHAGRQHRSTPAVVEVAKRSDIAAPVEVTPQISKKRDSKLKKRKKCKAVSVSKAHGSTTPTDSGSEGNDGGNSSGSDSSSGSASSGDVNWDVSAEFLKVGDIYVGFLPDDGSGGGSSETMSQINSMLPAKSAWHGRYAQVTEGKTFDGNQLYHVMDDVKANGAILAASVMPYKTWHGLTEGDNSNAIAIAKVCNDIYEKHGVEVWLRFAHESEWESSVLCFMPVPRYPVR